MSLDVVDLRDFYASPLGSTVRRLLAHRVRGRWRRAQGITVVGLGYASPYLGSFRGEAACIAALMPAHQGAVVWPPTGPVHTVLTEGHALPLADNSIDCLLAVHCLETSDGVRPLLREVWRVLKPEGRLLAIVPNRRSVWARLERTPFGHGHPYSRGQLEQLLRDALFEPIEWGYALFMPPIQRQLFLRSAVAWERMGQRLGSTLAGVFIVEARKETMAPVGGLSAARARRLAEAASG